MRQTDFHIHSIYSDGSDTPFEIMEQAFKRNIKTITLTDHDTLAGLCEARLAAEHFEIQFVNGIELSVSYDVDRLIHILGLGFDSENAEFLKIYTEFKMKRDHSLEYVLNCLGAFELSISRDMLIPFSYDGYMDRQCIARYLFQNGFSETMQSGWVDYLDKIPYLDEELLRPQDAFDMIHSGGGKAYIAHIHKFIGLYGYGEIEQLLRLKELKELGLDGIESHYPTYEKADIELIHRAIKEIGFIECGGSDYHGKNRMEVNIGD